VTPPDRPRAAGRPARAAAALLVAAAALLCAAPAPASAAAGATVDIVKVQGVIDPALAGYVRGTIDEAERNGSTVILQIDSGGSYGTEGRELGRFVRDATVPVIAWAGPAGARVQGAALFLYYGTGLVTMAPGAGLGPARPFDLGVRADGESAASVRANGVALQALAVGSGASPAGVASLVRGAELSAADALQSGATALVAADIPTLLRTLDGRTVQVRGQSVTLATLNRPGRPVDVRFHEIGLVARLLHAVSTPVAVYVLLVLGLWGLAFELTQPGLGLAGIGGAVFLAFAVYGLTVIPVHWLGIALLVAGMGLQGLDVVLKRFGVLTYAGTALFAAGSAWAWWGVAPNVDVPWWLIALLTVSGFLLFGFGFTVALKARERVRTAQVGLVGLVGEVRSDLNPEGGVEVKGALWRARSGNGSIPKGTKVRVRGIDGLILRVEPEPGAEAESDD
jgi:membrane-bound serine protease (ClpP class)